jgi:redox-sensitive bicupin YhaK (pirin superfamily)
METVTFILDGDIKHQDSTGHSSVMKQGGVQWMTAGKGLIHAETSSEEFMKEGGLLKYFNCGLIYPPLIK